MVNVAIQFRPANGARFSDELCPLSRVPSIGEHIVFATHQGTGPTYQVVRVDHLYGGARAEFDNVAHVWCDEVLDAPRFA